jgi:fluoroquinolone resistance protein
MEIRIHEDEASERINYSDAILVNHEFTECLFKNCNFTKSDLSDAVFMDCQFIDCNFSLTRLNDCGIKNVDFTNCKIMGIDFSKASNFLFSASFHSCILDYSVFTAKKMKKANFVDCSLKEVDFSGVDLTSAVFDNCDLLNVTFENTILEKCDFRTARNYSFDPELNQIKKAKFSHLGISGLLRKYDIVIEF